MLEEKFSVWIFFPNGEGLREVEQVMAGDAMGKLGEITRRPAVKLGVIVRAVVVDALDCTVAEWTAEQGYVFPRELCEAAQVRGLPARWNGRLD